MPLQLTEKVPRASFACVALSTPAFGYGVEVSLMVFTTIIFADFYLLRCFVGGGKGFVNDRLLYSLSRIPKSDAQLSENLTDIPGTYRVNALSAIYVVSLLAAVLFLRSGTIYPSPGGVVERDASLMMVWVLACVFSTAVSFPVRLLEDENSITVKSFLGQNIYDKSDLAVVAAGSGFFRRTYICDSRCSTVVSDSNPYD